MDRTYENALGIIDSRRRQARPKTKTLHAEPAVIIPERQRTSEFRGEPSIAGMTEWASMLGYNQNDINGLKIIHVAGTKGKGSTCAFAECFIRRHGQRTGYPLKIGLYTSPHLINPEERICIDSEPLDQALFAKYFFELYDKLPQLAEPYDPSKSLIERGPRFAQLFTLLTIHVFVREKVDAVILETHSGGEYDPTNIVVPEVATITALGMDHVEMLGPAIENIAWHKSGIYKTGAAALSARQDSSPAEVLERRAKEKGVNVRFVGIDERLPANAPQVSVKVQKENASLAIAAVEEFLKRTAPGKEQSMLTTEDIHNGVSDFAWPGRFQTMRHGKCTWFLDAAHNDMSIAIAAQWFADSSRDIQNKNVKPSRVLIFSHLHESRDSHALLETLALSLKQHSAGVQHVVFTTYDESHERKALKRSEKQPQFRAIWERVCPDTIVREESTISEAMAYASSVGGSDVESHVLITGSQYLIGPALRVLRSKGADF